MMSCVHWRSKVARSEVQIPDYIMRAATSLGLQTSAVTIEERLCPQDIISTRQHAQDTKHYNYDHASTGSAATKVALQRHHGILIPHAPGKHGSHHDLRYALYLTIVGDKHMIYLT